MRHMWVYVAGRKKNIDIGHSDDTSNRLSSLEVDKIVPMVREEVANVSDTLHVFCP